MAKKAPRKCERALEIGANVDTATRSSEAALSSLAEKIVFDHIGKTIKLGKIV